MTDVTNDFQAQHRLAEIVDWSIFAIGVVSLSTAILATVFIDRGSVTADDRPSIAATGDS